LRLAAPRPRLPTAAALFSNRLRGLYYYERVRPEWGTLRRVNPKARQVAGDKKSWGYFVFGKISRPFIWAGSLDFAAHSGHHSIKRQWMHVRARIYPDAAGHNVKRAMGGNP